MPAVTVLSSPKGLPMATTHSPTLSASESPSCATGRSALASILSTARSVLGSRPRTFAGNSRPSLSATLISFAFSTTWLLVMTMPSLRMMNPEPDPSWRPEGGCAGGNRKPGKGLSWPKGHWKPPSGMPVLTTDTTFTCTTAGDTLSTRDTNDGNDLPGTEVASGLSGAAAGTAAASATGWVKNPGWAMDPV